MLIRTRYTLMILLHAHTLLANNLSVIFSWPDVELEYFDEELMISDLKTGRNNPKNFVILDSAYYRYTYYVTTPSFLRDTYVTLSSVSTKMGTNGSPLLKPFPNWAWQSWDNCEGIISTYRIKIDELGRMWVIDSGVAYVFTPDYNLICPPKLLAFDLNNNNALITKYVFPSSDYVDSSIIINVDVQIMNGNPRDTYVYLTDPTSHRVLVYSLLTNTSHSVQHPYFMPDPNYINFTINGTFFTNEDGVFSLVVDKSRDIIYFSSLASGNKYYVKGDVLRKPGALTKKDCQSFKKLPYKDRKQTSITVLHYSGVLIYATLEDNAIWAWDTRTPYNPRYFKLIAQDDENLQATFGMKLAGNNLLATSNRLQNILAYQKNGEGINFRILKGRLAKLLS